MFVFSSSSNNIIYDSFFITVDVIYIKVQSGDIENHHFVSVASAHFYDTELVHVDRHMLVELGEDDGEIKGGGGGGGGLPNERRELHVRKTKREALGRKETR